MLTPIADEVWSAESHHRMGPGLGFPVRMTVVRLADGGIWLHSPIAIDDALAAAIGELGPVTDLVGPNTFHHVYLSKAARRYPEARVWGPAQLQSKRDDLTFSHTLDGSTPSQWGDALEVCLIDGTKLDEVVFFHPRSRTLVVTDLLFNIQKARGWLMPLVLRLVRAYRRPAQSRMIRFVTKDRSAVAASCRRVLEWDFERVVMAHGTPLEDNAKETLRGVLGWMLADPGSKQLASE